MRSYRLVYTLQVPRFRRRCRLHLQRILTINDGGSNLFENGGTYLEMNTISCERRGISLQQKSCENLKTLLSSYAHYMGNFIRLGPYPFWIWWQRRDSSSYTVCYVSAELL